MMFSEFPNLWIPGSRANGSARSAARWLAPRNDDPGRKKRRPFGRRFESHLEEEVKSGGGILRS